MTVPRAVIPVRAAAHADASLVAGTLSRAFIDDPVLAYLFPDAPSRPRKLTQFFTLIVGTEARPGDTIIAGDGAAATIWRAPGEWKTPTSTMLRSVVPMLSTFGFSLTRALRLQATMDRHHPTTPHWYLAFAGCDPALHGRGFGGAAIRAKLRDCDAEGLPAALETANEANLAIYTALGFVVTDTFDAAPDMPMWSMRREPVR
jgi:ribosomal protein S18 acetylase RimI-like enzyme